MLTDERLAGRTSNWELVYEDIYNTSDLNHIKVMNLL